MTDKFKLSRCFEDAPAGCGVIETYETFLSPCWTVMIEGSLATSNRAEKSISNTDISDEDSEEPQGSREVDQNGFVVAPGVANSMPAWQLSQMKQEQRLQKWRSMLGELQVLKEMPHLWAVPYVMRTLTANDVMMSTCHMWSISTCAVQGQGLLIGSSMRPSMQPR